MTNINWDFISELEGKGVKKAMCLMITLVLQLQQGLT